MTTTNIRLKKFQPSSINPGRIILLIGKRNTGKSVLVRDLLWYLRKIPTAVVFSPTEESNRAYEGMVPNLFINGEFDADVLSSIIKRQKKCYKNKVPNSEMLLLLDDCMYDAATISKNPDIRYIFMNGRHIGITLIITAQYMMALPPALRGNVDYVFTFREPLQTNRKKLFDQFFGIFQKPVIFNEVMNSCTENFECLCLDNTSRSNDISETVFWYKAAMRDKFRIGSKQYWSHAQKNFNKHYDEDEEEKQKRLSKAKGKGKQKDVIKVTKRH